MDPIIKWAGGKRKLLPELLAWMPENMGRYYEPFAGGAALFFALEPKMAWLTDMNGDLINMYIQVRDNVNEVSKHLEEFKRNHSETMFANAKLAFNGGELRSNAMVAAVFIYLNKSCFNGLWRVNRNGDFNVPYGKNDSPKFPDLETLKSASRILQDAGLEKVPFEDAVDSCQRGDFVYFDPPYIPASTSANFTSYTADGFDDAQQLRLLDTALLLDRRGVQVMLSNSDTPRTRELYKDERFELHRVERPGTMNSDPTKRQRVGELIITNRYPYKSLVDSRKSHPQLVG